MGRHFVVMSLFFLFYTCSCSQLVHVKTTVNTKNVVIAGHERHSELIRIPTGFGAVDYEITDLFDIKTTGHIERNQINTWALASSIGATAISLPLMIITGLFIANPSWLFAPIVSLKGAHSGAMFAYFNQTMSSSTIPITSLFALLGMAPLLGILKSEQVADTTQYLP